MIGNDVVDLQLAKNETNWKRNGYLEKIFTAKEQYFIKKSYNPEIMVWSLWSRKEAAYKIWNREFKIRKYNPIKFECSNFNSRIGKVIFETKTYYTKTEICHDFIYSIAVTNSSDFSKIKSFDKVIEIKKLNGIPFYINENKDMKVLSKTNHGRFEFTISL